MEGYLWKRRFYADGCKKGVLRRRYCILDAENEVICFKTTKEEEKVHKHVPLEEIASIFEYGDHGFIVSMRHVATHEACGAAFLFEVGTDGMAAGMDQGDTRAAWVKCFKGKVNSVNNGLDLVLRNTESVHSRYKIFCSPRSLLGTGMSGDVRMISRKRDQKSFAMKTISLSGISPARLGALRREIDILKAIDHPHIVRLQETFMEPKLYCRLVLELCEGGELFHRLNHRGHFTERYAGRLLTTMIKALNYLHSNNIVHRDLKLENWLFRKQEGYEPCHNLNEKGKKPHNCSCVVCEDDDIALIDFGLSRRFRSEDEEMVKQVGTCYYVAPEILSGHYKGTSCDMWSLGVIAYMLLSGSAPFDAEKDEDITRMIRKQNVPDIYNPEKDSAWANISKPCKDFVMKLLEKDPSKRYSTKDALADSWIQGILSSEHEDIHVPPQEHKINDTVLQRLKNFAKYKELKRLAMEVIAFSLDHNEIKELTDLFEVIDSDHDGYIKLEELVSALKDYENLDRKDVQEIFEALDEEHNGKVHVSEFVAGTLQAKYHLDEAFLHEAFSKLGGNKNKMNLDDLTRVLGGCASKERIIEIWEQSGLAEQSKTEDISFETFMMFMRTDGEKDLLEYRKKSKTPGSFCTLSEVEKLHRLKKDKNKSEKTGIVSSCSESMNSTRKKRNAMSRVKKFFLKKGNSVAKSSKILSGTVST